MELQSEGDKRALLIGEGAKNSQSFDMNFLVEAGAGAGKTTIIIQRIMEQLLERNYKPEEVVAITFTNKATEELRGRLDQKLREKLEDKKITLEKKEKINSLCMSLERMQVSTIHSFCQTLLRTMPFESELGMDFEVVENGKGIERNIFLQDVESNIVSWKPIRSLTINPKDLEYSFSSVIAAGDVELQFISAAETKELRDIIIEQAKEVWKEYVKGLSLILQPNEEESRLLNKEFLDLLNMEEKDLTEEDFLRFIGWLVYGGKEYLPTKPFEQKVEEYYALYKLANARKKEDRVPVPKAVENTPFYQALLFGKQIKSRVNSKSKSKTSLVKTLVNNVELYCHSVSMRNFDKLRQKVKEEKLRTGMIDNNDLLVKARNMLRDSKEARSYFRNKYKCIYVDEFQDTDPVQAELLFYLTTEEKYYSQDWKKCKPQKGSLFLVGDPKQAIYHFRGADIQVYLQVKKLFVEDGVGSVVVLQNNYRSTKEICTFSDKSFDKLMKGETQAPYASMVASNSEKLNIKGEIKLLEIGGVVKFDKSVKPDKKMLIKLDACMVGKFIYDYIEENSTAQYKDFLILTQSKANVAYYVNALEEIGIPCQGTGESVLSELVELKRMILHLQSLCDLRSEQKFALVLTQCYQVQMETIWKYRQLTSSEDFITSLTNMESINQVKNYYGSQEMELFTLCRACEEIVELRKKVDKLLPITLIEYIFQGGFGIWQSKELIEQEKSYGLIQQVIARLHLQGQGDLSDYRNLLEEMVGKTIEHQLLLKKQPNKVQIMNLHKAKGLEGKIVILTRAETLNLPVHQHIERGKGNQVLKLHMRVVTNYKSIVGIPSNWTEQEKKEKEYVKEEKVRLLYVAATRAEERLYISTPKDTSDSKTGSTWKQLSVHVADTDIEEIEFDMEHTKLTTSVEEKEIDLLALEQKLEQKKRVCQCRSIYQVTPSQLDHAAPPKKKDDESIEVDHEGENIVIDEQEKLLLETFGYDLTDYEVKVENKQADQLEVIQKHTPYGPDWGTMVHRTLELLVRNDEFADISPYARQAVYETLDSGSITVTQSKQLFGEVIGEVQQKQISLLAAQLEEQIEFIKDADHELRKLMSKGQCFPEMNFYSYLMNGELYEHVYQHVSSKQDGKQSQEFEGKAFEVQGIVDLAIMTEDGWVIVDYKTDKIKQDETKENYKKRLHEEYDNQIQAYGKLLDSIMQNDHGCAAKVCICAIPLKGELL